MIIRKGIVVSFLPCLVAFWGFHPYSYVLSFFLMFFFVTVLYHCDPWVKIKKTYIRLFQFHFLRVHMIKTKYDSL